MSRLSHKIFQYFVDFIYLIRYHRAMIESKPRYVPITEANTDRIFLAPKLPEYVKAEKIGIDVERITRLCDLGGIERLFLAGKNDGETSKVEVGIGKLSANGEATATAATKTTIEPTHKSYSLVNGDPGPHSFCWTDALITMNTKEINQRIIEDRRWTRGVRDINAWSNYIDNCLRGGISEVGTRHLTVGLSNANWLNLGIQVAIGTGMEIAMGPSVTTTITRIFIVSAMLNALNFMLYKDSLDTKYRFSLFYGPQIDRAILLWVLSKNKRLVTSLE